MGRFFPQLTGNLGVTGFVAFYQRIDNKIQTEIDFWDFIVSTNLLPIGSLVITLFCTNKRLGWGWDNLVNEANQGKGIKIKNWMKPIFKYFVPICVLTIYIMGLVMFKWN